MKFHSSEVALYLYESNIRPCIEYSCHGAPNCYLTMLDELQKWYLRMLAFRCFQGVKGEHWEEKDEVFLAGRTLDFHLNWPHWLLFLYLVGCLLVTLLGYIIFQILKGCL